MLSMIESFFNDTMEKLDISGDLTLFTKSQFSKMLEDVNSETG